MSRHHPLRATGRAWWLVLAALAATIAAGLAGGLPT